MLDEIQPSGKSFWLLMPKSQPSLVRSKLPPTLWFCGVTGVAEEAGFNKGLKNSKNPPVNNNVKNNRCIYRKYWYQFTRNIIGLKKYSSWTQSINELFHRRYTYRNWLKFVASRSGYKEISLISYQFRVNKRFWQHLCTGCVPSLFCDSKIFI